MKKYTDCPQILRDFCVFGHNIVERREIMHLKGWAITMGVGAAAGAVAIMMMPRNNPTRRLAAKAANKVEEAAWKVSDKLTQEFDL